MPAFDDTHSILYENRSSLSNDLEYSEQPNTVGMKGRAQFEQKRLHDLARACSNLPPLFGTHFSATPSLESPSKLEGDSIHFAIFDYSGV